MWHIEAYLKPRQTYLIKLCCENNYCRIFSKKLHHKILTGSELCSCSWLQVFHYKLFFLFLLKNKTYLSFFFAKAFNIYCVCPQDFMVNESFLVIDYVLLIFLLASNLKNTCICIIPVTTEKPKRLTFTNYKQIEEKQPLILELNECVKYMLDWYKYSTIQR